MSMNAVDDHFITPPTPDSNKDYSDNNVYEIGETFTVSWVKSFPTRTLALIQDNKPRDRTGGPKNEDFGKYEWIVNYSGLDPNVNNVFYFGFGDGSSQGFSSHYFNITDNEDDDTDSPDDTGTGPNEETPTPAPTTTSASMFSSTVSPRSTTSPTTSTSLLPTNTGSPNTESLSAGEIVGIFVGVTLGTILGAAILGFLVWCIRNKRKAPVNAVYDASQYVQPQVFVLVEQPQQLMSTPIAEMEGAQKRNGHHEMS
ncbi:hypothetical protein NPX13_g4168 [Xylaria arbuscula]|uniref:Mid2 domain-containing protein n=1 Tax=Xylaria arbuscula TaxID=114810 RepID=A0A9W8NGV1_9PEZI|nr:hypothetical protein NPX13_g4168 [Xylaria arbuscula]